MVLYNPFSKFGISQTWSQGSHRYPYNAIDFKTPVGYSFGSPADGVYKRMPSNLSRTDPTAAGHYGYLLLPNGDRIYFCHLHKHVAADGAKVRQGDTLAQTGNSGYVRPNPDATGNPDDGAHVHTYAKRSNDTRYDWTIGATSTLPEPSGQLSYNRTQVVLARKGLNLRKSPSADAPKMTRSPIPAGSVVKTGRSSGGWTPVKWGSTTGWVASEFLRLRTKKVGKANLWLRAKPAGKATAKLKLGTKVTVLGVHGDTNKATWVHVRVGARTGYVHGGYLK